MSEIGLGQALMGLLVAAVLGGGAAIIIWNSFMNMGRKSGTELEAQILEELHTLRARVDALAEQIGPPGTTRLAEGREGEESAPS